MAVKFFGQYLIEQNLIISDQLLEAIALQDKTNRKLGEIVEDMGFMSLEQVEQVHQAQRSEDIRFGDKAIDLGLLTSEQLDQALLRQRNDHLYIGEALVKVKAIQQEDLSGHLESFKRDQQPYAVDKIDIPDCIKNRKIWEMVADLTYKMLTRVTNMSFRPGPCEAIDKLPVGLLTAEIAFSGHINALYLLAVSPHSRDLIARAMLQEDDISEESSEVLEDTTMEFINIVCGNIAAKAAQYGFQIDISPPRLHLEEEEEILVPQGFTGLKFPLHLGDGETFEMAVFVNDELK